MSNEQLDGFARTPAPSEEKSNSTPPRRSRRSKELKTSAPGSEAVAPASVQAARHFFPCNREDALLLLGSLLISPAFFRNGVRLAVKGDDLAFVDGILNQAESDMLAAGRPERFPILLEVSAAAAGRSARALVIGDILRLVFRSNEESEEFRFRPVDEFDTESLEASVEPALFGGSGSARFSLRPPLDESDEDMGYVADRIAAGVHGAVGLARTAPELASAVVEFFSHPGAGEGQESFNFYVACSALRVDAADSVPTRRQAAIVAAFANDSGLGARALVESVAQKLTESGSRTDEETRQETRWEATVHGALRGRIAIDGEHVSDQGSILLRAALLGTIADKPASLLPFLNAERPAGVRVSLQASFLAGLKRGVLQTSWKDKSRDAVWVSALLRELVAGPTSVGAKNPLVVVRVTEVEGRKAHTIAVAGHVVASFPTEISASSAKLTSEWLEALATSGYDVLGPGRVPHSWIIALGPDQTVEVSHAEAGGIHFPLLRYSLEGGRKFKKVKEVSSALQHVGTFWHRGEDTTEREYLYCDLPALPGLEGRTLLSAKLSEALTLSTVTAKTPRSKSRRPAAKRASSDMAAAKSPEPSALPQEVTSA